MRIATYPGACAISTTLPGSTAGTGLKAMQRSKGPNSATLSNTPGTKLFRLGRRDSAAGVRGGRRPFGGSTTSDA